MENNSSSSTTKIIGGIVAVLVCCACAVIVVAAGILFYESKGSSDTTPFPTAFLTPLFDATNTPFPNSDTTPLPTLEPTLSSGESVPTDTIEALLATNVPENNPYELACRLKKLCNVPNTVSSKSYKLGDKEKFWISNQDTVENSQITATLLYVTPHLYFWSQDGVTVNKADMKRLMDTFENEIYPTDREFFGSEWTPGVDDDEHIFVIYAKGLGESIAGYFNSSDSYNPIIKKYSNGHETFMVSADNQVLGDSYVYAVLAHEFVHMIQFPTDRNDNTWMIEGFAEVGAFINGYNPGVFGQRYASKPDLQLTDWSSGGDNTPHYGQSFLYLTYFLDRFGREATKALSANPENGLHSVDDTLADLNIIDALTSKLVTADDVFMDWAAALFLKDENVGDGRYFYHNYPDAPQTDYTNLLDTCPGDSLDAGVKQYGIDYIEVKCTGDHILHFSGATAVKLLPKDAHSGKYAFWSNQGDESDMTLTREFDLTSVSGTVTLDYQTWYNIEEDWDYVYVEASTDGKTWDILKTPTGTDTNPSGNSYGWGYTGFSHNWLEEQVDLSKYAGQKVQIRFEYVTDAAVNEQGLMVDDIRIDALNYQSDFETGDDGWVADGFVRIQNILPQTYRLTLIIMGDTTTVTTIELNADNTVDIPLSLNAGDKAILIVTGTTRFTKTSAEYQIEIK